MAFDEGLAQRLRDELDALPFVEKQMFGGIAFMVEGNMCVGVIGDELIARIGPERYDQALERPGSRVFDFTGRPMKGWIAVSASAVEADDDLAAWVADALRFVRTLPPK